MLVIRPLSYSPCVIGRILPVEFRLGISCDDVDDDDGDDDEDDEDEDSDDDETEIGKVAIEE